MAGTPMRNAQARILKERLEELVDALSEGLTDSEAMRRLGIKRHALGWLESHDTDAAEAIQRARKQGAIAMASDTVDIADKLELNVMADPVRVAQARIGTRQWLASRRNREAFGEQAKVAVQVNVGNLHLTALQHSRQTPAIGVDVVEGELVQAPTLPAADNLNDIL